METPTPEHLKFAVLATDVALFTIRDGQLLVRLFHVTRPPHFPNNWGLPGGLVSPKETAHEASERLLADRAAIASKKVHLEQLYTFDAVKRDPRGRVVAVAYLGLIAWEKLSDIEKSDSGTVKWVPVAKAKGLAYDHDEMLALAKNRLASRSEYTTIIQKMLPHEFTLTELEKAYVCLQGRNLDKRNFRKKILKLKILKPLKTKKTGGAFRPAQLYSFVSQNVEELAIL
jgi:8-oxo-dGTP diphosphatase